MSKNEIFTNKFYPSLPNVPFLSQTHQFCVYTLRSDQIKVSLITKNEKREFYCKEKTRKIIFWLRSSISLFLALSATRLLATMILILVVILVALLFIHFTWNFNYWSKRGVPSPPPKFLLGNLPNMLLRKQNVAYDMEKIYK